MRNTIRMHSSRWRFIRISLIFRWVSPLDTPECTKPVTHPCTLECSPCPPTNHNFTAPDHPPCRGWVAVIHPREECRIIIPTWVAVTDKAGVTDKVVVATGVMYQENGEGSTTIIIEEEAVVVEEAVDGWAGIINGTTGVDADVGAVVTIITTITIHKPTITIQEEERETPVAINHTMELREVNRFREEEVEKHHPEEHLQQSLEKRKARVVRPLR
mmetsp:Transcript_6677/g.8200  ORF Transcript_6677/g.8200 Transcript_6677/m.8200 type:complete len:216 (+) Transcript_6677:234-881(+)